MEIKKANTSTLMLLLVIYISSFFIVISFNDSDILTIFGYFRTLFLGDINKNLFWYILSWLSFISLFLSTYCYISYVRDDIAIRLKESVFFSLTSFAGFSLLFFLCNQNTAKEYQSWSMNIFPFLILFFASKTEYDFIRTQPNFDENSKKEDPKAGFKLQLERPAKYIALIVGTIAWGLGVLKLGEGMGCSSFGDDKKPLPDFFSFLPLAAIITMIVFCFQYAYKKYKASK